MYIYTHTRIYFIVSLFLFALKGSGEYVHVFFIFSLFSFLAQVIIDLQIIRNQYLKTRNNNNNIRKTFLNLRFILGYFFFVTKISCRTLLLVNLMNFKAPPKVDLNSHHFYVALYIFTLHKFQIMHKKRQNVIYS